VNEDIHQFGYLLGRYWARRDAKPDQLLHIRKLGDGKDWIGIHDDPGKALTGIIEKNKDSFLGTAEDESPSFLVGFIDGAQSVESSS
jgi:hypothetical protein